MEGPAAIELTGILHAVGREIAAALVKLPNLPEVRPHAVTLHRLEDEGDRVERAALDAGEHVGNALQGLIVRNV
jgi:hypothetical protein